MKKQTFYGMGFRPAKKQYYLIAYDGQVFRCGQYEFGWDGTKKECIELSTGFAICNDKTMKDSISFITDHYSLIDDRIPKMAEAMNKLNNLLNENEKFQPRAEQVILTAKRLQ